MGGSGEDHGPVQTGTTPRSCDFTAHMCTGMILSNYKLFVVYLDYTYYINILEDAYGCKSLTVHSCVNT